MPSNDWNQTLGIASFLPALSSSTAASSYNSSSAELGTFPLEPRHFLWSIPVSVTAIMTARAVVWSKFHCCAISWSSFRTTRVSMYFAALWVVICVAIEQVQAALHSEPCGVFPLLISCGRLFGAAAHVIHTAQWHRLTLLRAEQSVRHTFMLWLAVCVFEVIGTVFLTQESIEPSVLGTVLCVFHGNSTLHRFWFMPLMSTCATLSCYLTFSHRHITLVGDLTTRFDFQGERKRMDMWGAVSIAEAAVLAAIAIGPNELGDAHSTLFWIDYALLMLRGSMMLGACPQAKRRRKTLRVGSNSDLPPQLPPPPQPPKVSSSGGLYPLAETRELDEVKTPPAECRSVASIPQQQPLRQYASIPGSSPFTPEASNPNTRPGSPFAQSLVSDPNPIAVTRK